MALRFVAIGDSFTEGVGDWEPRLPNGVRGWADRVAKQLGKADPRWEYANLAIRSRRLRGIIDEQLEPALALQPSVVTFYAGGNDLLEFRQDLPALLELYSQAVARLCASGARVLLFTGFDIALHPVLGPLRRRNELFNAHVRALAAEYGATLVDYWAWDVYRDRRLWGNDKLHMNRAGHRYMAIRILEILGIDHRLAFEPLGPHARVGPGQALLRDVEWARQWVVPMFGRRLRGITLGDDLGPRWPDPIRPAEGMKKLYRARRREPASE
ncbi:SGNH/GDSL hydrolase family protein [Arthrobacter sp. JSM 101049]|uniref:SGNH/GDSL hydrolase family protein n=1 Tax=Arthrobacter sp. JSM 101049 TaxID=929097 RepID=UPI00356645FD